MGGSGGELRGLKEVTEASKQVEAKQVKQKKI